MADCASMVLLRLVLLLVIAPVASGAVAQPGRAALRQPYLQLDADRVCISLQSRDPAVQVTGLEAGHDGL